VVLWFDSARRRLWAGSPRTVGCLGKRVERKRLVRDAAPVRQAQGRLYEEEAEDGEGRGFASMDGLTAWRAGLDWRAVGTPHFR